MFHVEAMTPSEVYAMPLAPLTSVPEIPCGPSRPLRRDLRAPGPFSPPFRRQTARRRKEKDPSLRRRETMLPVFS